MKANLYKNGIRMSKIMLYAFIGLQSVLMAMANGAGAQRKMLDEIEVQLEKSGSSRVGLIDLIAEIEAETDFSFAYSERAIRNRKVDLTLDNYNMRSLMSEISVQAKVSVKRINETIAIIPVDNSEDLPNVKEEIQQAVSISGTITDEAGEPLPGATVLEKGTSNGTITDLDGKFSLKVSQNATVMVSFVGYLTQETSLNGRSVLNFQLSPDLEQLEEVVVVGYGTQKKADVTNAIASMDAKGLSERPLGRVDQAMIGQMAGVRVKQTSGIPGQGFSIQVRGTGSISANNEPLYVVDGFPLEVSPQSTSGGFGNGNPLSNLNPNDIESIQVLKDAAAASIYGSRGSNGVVLITTKKGSSGKPQISFNSYIGFNETVKKLDVLSSQQWVDRQMEHMNYFWVRDYGSQGASSTDTNEERRALLGLGADQYNVKYMLDERWLQEGHPGLDYVDWQDKFFRKGVVQNYQLAATGGNDITKYYVSGDYLDQEGIARGVHYNRYSARANVEVSPSDRVKFGLNLSPSYSVLQDPGVEGKDAITHIIVGMQPVVESSTGAIGTNVGEYAGYAWGTSRVSPLAEALYKQNSTKTFRNLSTAFVELGILPGLNFRTSLNFDIHNSNSERFTPAFVTRNRTASGGRSGYTRINFVEENTLNYSKTISQHTFNVLAGYSYSAFKFSDFSISGTGFASDDIATLNAASSTSGSASSTENVLISYFGRLQYNFDDRYLIQTSFRRDGSSKFGDNTKWGVFPSVSLGWRVSEEAFFSDLTMFSDLKVRASWGLAGNNGVNDYDQIAKLAYANYSYGGVLSSGQVPSNFANPDLGWETSETVDVGFDIGVLDNRVYASFDYYTKKNTDLLLNIPVPTASGFANALTNIGEVMNKGWELELNTRNLVGAFTWDTKVNLSHNENEIKKLGPNNTPIYGGAFDITHNILEVGKPMYTLYLVQQDGLLTSADIANGYPTYGSQEAGDPRYVDQLTVDTDGDGKPDAADGVIDADDRTYSGHPNPNYVWGFTNNFGYKGFDLSVLVQGQMGGKIYSTFGRAMYRTGMGSNENTLGLAKDRVIWEEGKEYTEADLAGKERKSPSTFGRVKNTDWLYPNDYWRIRNITLGYDLGRLFDSNVISGARVYMTAENWFGGDKYKGGFNPEAVNNSGDDYGAFPLSRSIVFGLNLKL